MFIVLFLMSIHNVAHKNNKNDTNNNKKEKAPCVFHQRLSVLSEPVKGESVMCHVFTCIKHFNKHTTENKARGNL